jgi:predicted ATPase
VYGETHYKVGGMHNPDDAVRLFAQCAQRVDSTFLLSPENTPLVARICGWLEAMPLGIELAAAWLSSLTLDEIADELQQGLALLDHKSYRLRAVFDRSWALLSEKQRQVFRRMSIFRGGSTRQAAEAVTAANLQTSTALVDKSLLRRSVEGRFDMHELLRQYAEEQLTAAGEADSIRAAHMHYFAARLGSYEADLRSPRELEILNDIERDFENLRTAWTWAIAYADDAAIDQMLMSLYVFADMRSHMQDVQQLFDLALDRFTAEPGAPRRVYGRLLAATRRWPAGRTSSAPTIPPVKRSRKRATWLSSPTERRPASTR